MTATKDRNAPDRLARRGHETLLPSRQAAEAALDEAMALYGVDSAEMMAARWHLKEIVRRAAR